MRKALAAAFFLAAAAAAWLLYFALTPVALPATPYDFTVRPGSGLKAVTRQLSSDGVLEDPASLWILGRIVGAARIQAGTYRLDRPLTPLDLIGKMVRGEVLYEEMLFVEGSTLRQWLAQLATQPGVRQTLAGKKEPDIRPLMGETASLEGWFFPDTYRFAPGTSDVDVLKRAHAVMKKRVADAWEARDPSLALATPYDALILASIVEKETAKDAERPMIAAVFLNRLKRGMRLQTDPTVIYGLGERYDGHIHKRDLTADTPWNTYTRDGLPPTPIAMPGEAAIQAATHPAATDYLYFVSRNDGSHEFSRTLEEHNRAVARYQLGR
ncbi:MAG TPA: endolytic transglycosylase MltG [Usitatibacter sp.]|nr:endolytic transglycosylase MltG [Usitatibacter sp.]